MIPLDDCTSPVSGPMILPFLPHPPPVLDSLRSSPVSAPLRCSLWQRVWPVTAQRQPLLSSPLNLPLPFSRGPGASARSSPPFPSTLASLSFLSQRRPFQLSGLSKRRGTGTHTPPLLGPGFDLSWPDGGGGDQGWGPGHNNMAIQLNSPSV